MNTFSFGSLDFLTTDTYNIIPFTIIGLILILIGIGKKGNMSSFILLGLLVAIFPFTMPYTGQAVTSLFLKEDSIIKEEPKLYFKDELKVLSKDYPNIFIADDGYEFLYRPNNLQQISLMDRWGAIQFYEHKINEEYYLTDNVTLKINYTDEAPYIEVFTYKSESKFQNYLLNNPRTFKSPVYVNIYINSENQISSNFSFKEFLIKGVKFIAY